MRTLVFLLGLITPFVCSETSLGGQVRSLRRDGVNAAWFFVNLDGRTDYVSLDESTFLAPKSRLSLRDIQQLAATFGRRSELVGLSYSDLCTQSGPAIVLLRHAIDAEGQFAVVLTARSGSVDVLRAGSIEVEQLHEDDFRRLWTGHAVIVIQPSSIWYQLISVTFGAFVAVMLHAPFGRSFLSSMSQRACLHRHK